MKDLRIEHYLVNELVKDVNSMSDGFNAVVSINGAAIKFFVKRNATPQQFIKHLRSMIWAIEKRSEENEG